MEGSVSSLPSPPPLPSFAGEPLAPSSPSPSPLRTSASSPSPSSSPSSSSPISGHHVPLPPEVAQHGNDDDSLDDVPFESVTISDAPPAHPVIGTGGGSEGSLAEMKAERRRAAGSILHSPKPSRGGAVSSSSPPLAQGTFQASSNGFGSHSRNSSLSAAQASAAHRPATTSPLSRNPPQSSSSSSVPPPAAISSSSAPTSTLAPVSSSSSSPQPSSSSLPDPTRKKPPASSGPSIFERVRSKTRQKDLPPKVKVEDELHLQEWEAMMKASKEHERQRIEAAKAAEAARVAKQASLLPIWTADILPSPRTAVANDPKLRSIWWDGIPPRYRGDLWERVGGNALGLSNNSYATHVRRFEIAVEQGRFPAKVLKELEKDADGAYPGLKIFKRGGSMFAPLREFLGAWVVARSDEGFSYMSGLHLIAANLLLNMPPTSAWKTLLNLLSSSGCLRAFYDPGGQAEREAYYRVLNTLCSDTLPKVYYNLMANNVQVPESWFRTLFVEQLNFDTSCRVFDQILLDGDSFIFRTCIALLFCLEQRLYDPDPSELRAVLTGHALVVPPLAGLALGQPRKLSAEMVVQSVELGEKEESLAGGGGIYGVEEARLFRVLEERGEGWKEQSFERLVKRELDSGS